MKRYLLILAFCGSAQAGSALDESLRDLQRLNAEIHQQEVLRQNEEVIKRLEEIQRQQEEILSEQRRLERDSTDYWGRPW
jgi:hypothetical protein